MPRHRFCIIRTDRKVTGSCLRLLGEPPHPELAPHPCTENNLLQAEEEEGRTFLAAVCGHVAVGDTGWPGASPHPADPRRYWAQPITQAPGLCSSLPRALLWDSICKARAPQPGKPREMHLFPHHTQGWVYKDRYDWGVSTEAMLLLRDLSSTDTQETAVGPPSICSVEARPSNIS